MEVQILRQGGIDKIWLQKFEYLKEERRAWVPGYVPGGFDPKKGLRDFALRGFRATSSWFRRVFTKRRRGFGGYC